MSGAALPSNLTQAQSLIWTGQQLHPEAPLYNMVLAFRIQGPVDIGAFGDAFAALVSGTDSMRTVFVDAGGVAGGVDAGGIASEMDAGGVASGEEGRSTVRRVVLDTMPTDLEIIDLSGEPDPEAAYVAWAGRDAKAMFDLADGLYRAALVKLGPEEFVWWLAQHHLITDGWAATIVYGRMEELYRAAVAGELAGRADDYPSFEDYADYEARFRSSDAHSEAKAFWKAKIDSDLPPLRFYGVAPPTGGTTRTDRTTIDLGSDRGERLGELNGGGGLMGGVSQFNLFATVLLACMARVTGQRRLAILAPAHNRPSPRFKATAGLFIEVLPLQITIEDGETFRSLLDKVNAQAQELLVNARPGTSTATHNRAYSVLLNFINASFGDFNGWPMRSEWVHPGHGDADHSLRLQVHDFDGTGNFRLHFDLNRHVFNDERRKAIARHFVQLLDVAVDDPDQPIAEADLLTGAEKESMVLFNETDATHPVSTVVEGFDAQVAATPDAIAVVGEAGRFTYAELDLASQRLASRLVGIAGPAPRVGIHLRRSPELVVAVWAVLRAGGSYVPIDSQYPPDRAGHLVADSAAQLVISDDELGSRLDGLAVPMIGVAGDGEPNADDPAKNRKMVPPTPDDPAYVMYTSGSTGEPKGVVVTHANLVNYVWWARDQYSHGERVSFPLYSSFGFDLTVTSLFVPLMTGGSVVVYAEPDGSDLSVRDVFTDDRVDVVKLTPSHLSLLEPELLNTTRIRTLIVGGEEFATAVAEATWEASGGRLEIVNEYGPTEATVGCMAHRYDPATDVYSSVSIGVPAANTRIHVLTDDLAAVPLGVVGEIWVGGSGVADGYLGRPDLTGERFVDDPHHPGAKLYRTGDLARWRGAGDLEFLGRADHQVKVRGYRIELGEIEAALNAHPSISASVVDVVDTEIERAASGADIDYCERCGLASNHPDARLNTEGVCQPCLFYDQHRASAAAYFATMEDLHAMFPADRERNADGQDCVALLSGGKDSTYALYQLVEMGLTPLVFTLDNGFISEGAKTNIRRAVDDLGLELVMGTTPAMNAIFADSLAQFSNVCQGCFKTVYTLGMNLAHERGLAHVITGLSRGQIFETRLADLFRIGITDRDDVDAAIIEARRAYHRVDDEVRRSLDTAIFDDDHVFDNIAIVDFYRYHDVGLDRLLGFLAEHAPWVRPSDTGRSTNCLINNTGIYVHKKEREFHNYALPYSWDVRLGHKTRTEALAELDDEIDVVQVRNILDQVGYEIAVPDGTGSPLRGTDKRLVGYYVSTDPNLSSADVRGSLAARLPEHTVPSYLVRLDELPLTVNGKVDHFALPDPRRQVGSDGAEYAGPRSTTEEVLVDIWETVLGVERIGIHDPFIELGGDSILNIAVVATAKRRGLAFTSQQLFQHQTVAELAAVATKASPSAPEGPQGAKGNGSGDPFADSGLSSDDLEDVLKTFGESS